ncbi:MAG: hypothetical protein IPG90_18915 [Bacteroidetes bacterium]|nr:hypothetical protein [Bacteroidota bacterium]
MTGWDFLENMKNSISGERTDFNLYSILFRRSEGQGEGCNNKYVKGYLEKPLQVDVIKKYHGKKNGTENEWLELLPRIMNTSSSKHSK